MLLKTALSWIVASCIESVCLCGQIRGQITPRVPTLVVNASPTAFGSQTSLHLSATVTSGADPVTLGEVVFTINGQDSQPVTLPGLAPAVGRHSGIALADYSAPPGNYRITAKLLANSAWAAAQSDVQTVSIPESGEVVLAASNNRNGSTSFTVNTRVSNEGSGFPKAQVVDLASGQAITSSPTYSGSPKLFAWKRAIESGSNGDVFAEGALTPSGRSDFVLLNRSTGTAFTYLQNADLTWTLAQTLKTGLQPTAVAIQDFNGDGAPDLAVVNAGDGTVKIFLQDPHSAGSFLTSPITITVGTTPSAISSADFNGDGLPDLVVSNFADDTLSVLTNESSLEGLRFSVQTIASQHGPTALAVGDFTGSHLPDVAVANFFDDNVSVFANTPQAGALLSPTRSVFPVGEGPVSLATADLNGDGLPDIAAANSLDGTVSILETRNNKPGDYSHNEIVDGFSAPASIAATPAFWAASTASLLVGDSQSGDLNILQNDSTGRFPNRFVVSLGGKITSVLPLTLTDSGAYSLLALDSASAQLYLATQAWVATGDFDPISGVPSSQTRQFVAKVSPGPKSEQLISNIVTIPAAVHTAQQVSFTPPRSVMYGTGPVALSANADSGLPVEFRLKRGPGRVVGNQLTVLGAGNIVVEAVQNGDQTFAAATPVSRLISVAPATVILTPYPAERQYGAVNSAFSGEVVGEVNGDDLHVDWASSASKLTLAGMYSKQPFGIIGILAPGIPNDFYLATSSVGALTIQPAPSSESTPPSSPSGPSNTKPVIPPLTNNLPPAGSDPAPPTTIGSTGTTVPPVAGGPSTGQAGPQVPSTSATMPSPIGIPPLNGGPKTGTAPPAPQKPVTSNTTIAPVLIPLPSNPISTVSPLPIVTSVLSAAASLFEAHHATHTAGDSSKPSLQLFVDDRTRVAWWDKVVVSLTCPLALREEQTILLSADGHLLSTVSAKSGTDLTLFMKPAGLEARTIIATVGNSVACGGLKSAPVLLDPRLPDPVDLEDGTLDLLLQEVDLAPWENSEGITPN